MSTPSIEIDIPVDAHPLLTALDKLIWALTEHPELAPLLREELSKSAVIGAVLIHPGPRIVIAPNLGLRALLDAWGIA
ncbi:hypothetical protein [Burkholderia multivorans]|uniref:hypothetical protein n=1 Tax=Burkholderia multivorans TaxID=87883 RepID=UPI000A96A9A6|nr:hypothetical protein [Burkholderia multivorans]